MKIHSKIRDEQNYTKVSKICKNKTFSLKSYNIPGRPCIIVLSTCEWRLAIGELDDVFVDIVINHTYTWEGRGRVQLGGEVREGARVRGSMKGGKGGAWGAMCGHGEAWGGMRGLGVAWGGMRRHEGHGGMGFSCPKGDRIT